MKSFVSRMQSFEGKDGILSVSLGHGFPWGDVPESGAKLWVVADRDIEKAHALAAQLGREFWDLRDEVTHPPLSIKDAVARVQASSKGPMVMADVGDNAGGGRMGDSPFVLAAPFGRGSGREGVGQKGMY